MDRGFRPGSFSYIRFLGELSGASENSSSCSSAHAARWTHSANVSFYKLVARTVLVHQTAAPQNPQALRSLVRIAISYSWEAMNCVTSTSTDSRLFGNLLN